MTLTPPHHIGDTKQSCGVVEKHPYFNARLSGTWTETDILELSLSEPCCLGDFLTLIRRLNSFPDASTEDPIRPPSLRCIE